MYTLPELTYDYGALSRSISADIMKLHHDVHHQGYVNKLNAALEGHDDLQQISIEELLVKASTLDDVKLATTIKNQGGGHYNHSLYWLWMNPNGGNEPTGDLAAKLVDKYGSYQGFVDEFTTKSLGVFGSGWCWLLPDLSIVTTPNQDNPLWNGQAEPILGIDVWEHAYYLDYKAGRGDYVKAWWDVVDWDFVAHRYSDSL